MSGPDWYGNVQHWVQRAEKAEARVAELEALLEKARPFVLDAWRDTNCTHEFLDAIDAVLAKGRAQG